jgi:hypothetical protein
MNDFTAWLAGRLWPLLDGPSVVLETLPDGGRVLIEVAQLAALFASVTVPSYSNMVAVDDEKGYGFRPYLAAWKKQGLL